MKIGQLAHYRGDVNSKQLAMIRGICWSPLGIPYELYGIVLSMSLHRFYPNIFMVECRITYLFGECVRHRTINFYDFELEVVNEE